jgi:cytochrome oxidase Cu insertion factor (SCO1/SenC/PrrC family)
MGKLFQIDPARPTPEQIAKQLNDIKDDLDGIIVVYRTKDGVIDISYNYQKFQDLVYLAKALEVYVTNSMLSTPEQED